MRHALNTHTARAIGLNLFAHCRGPIRHEKDEGDVGTMRSRVFIFCPILSALTCAVVEAVLDVSPA